MVAIALVVLWFYQLPACIITSFVSSAGDSTVPAQYEYAPEVAKTTTNMVKNAIKTTNLLPNFNNIIFPLINQIYSF